METNSRACLNCGFQVPYGEQNCPHCGAKQIAAARAPNRTLWTVMLVIIGLPFALCAACSIALLNDPNNSIDVREFKQLSTIVLLVTVPAIAFLVWMVIRAYRRR